MQPHLPVKFDSSSVCRWAAGLTGACVSSAISANARRLLLCGADDQEHHGRLQCSVRTHVGPTLRDLQNMERVIFLLNNSMLVECRLVEFP